ncbi:hypothetical protein E2562_008796 [Oryza meyeriana var. granulata]|uniref:Disease resistance R13L4/SHOC-2-like LRR domain-containing protein n=1 Tax=Oryza meyeriana var. granulata TaxID=110450 RepID=A0A6G1CZ36_9ORYZ|nr:hypothetical protein E2562_008796 [Oryza meyeriana var. granulata]
MADAAGPLADLVACRLEHATASPAGVHGQGRHRWGDGRLLTARRPAPPPATGPLATPLLLSPSLPSLSVHVWIKEGSCRGGGAYLTFEKGAMPKLEKLELPLHVLMGKSHGFYLGINNLLCLKEAVVEIYDVGANHSDTKAAAASIMSEANANPNHPRLAISRANREESSREGSDDNEDAEGEQGGATDN